MSLSDSMIDFMFGIFLHIKEQSTVAIINGRQTQYLPYFLCVYNTNFCVGTDKKTMYVEGSNGVCRPMLRHTR